MLVLLDPGVWCWVVAGDENAAPVLTGAELEARRWDGYRGLVAPQLRGDGGWPKASLQAGFEVRIQAAVDAMVTRVPFWFAVCSGSTLEIHILRLCIKLVHTLQDHKEEMMDPTSVSALCM
jgi:hypothetical protein